MKLNELKTKVFELTATSNIKQIKSLLPQFAEANFRLKSTWERVHTELTEYYPVAPKAEKYSQEVQQLVINSISIPREAIACGWQAPESEAFNQVETAAQRLRRQFRKKKGLRVSSRLRIEHKGFAKTA